jgi:hypothetical protein
MLGLDAFVSAANVVYLFSYSVRDILWLRILTIGGASLLMPYYYYQASPLWAPIWWNVVFIAINIYWIAKLALERRPVPFTDEERRLYQLAFRNMKERDAFKLFRLGAWSSQPAGTILVTEGRPLDVLSLIVDGEVSVEMDGTQVDTLREGRFLGSSAFLNRGTHYTTPVTVRATRPTRIVAWQFPQLAAQLAKDEDLEVAVEASLGLEISRYLQTARAELLQFRHV